MGVTLHGPGPSDLRCRHPKMTESPSYRIENLSSSVSLQSRIALLGASTKEETPQDSKVFTLSVFISASAGTLATVLRTPFCFSDARTTTCKILLLIRLRIFGHFPRIIIDKSDKLMHKVIWIIDSHKNLILRYEICIGLNYISNCSSKFISG